MKKLMGVWRSILIILAIQTANPFNGMSKDCRACVFLQKRDIEKGVEQTFNYQWDKVMGKKPTKCLCGEENCRGYIEK